MRQAYFAIVLTIAFSFLNLGYNGYAKIAYKDLRNARMLARALENTYFTVSYLTSKLFHQLLPKDPSQILSDIHRKAPDTPADVDEEDPNY